MEIQIPLDNWNVVEGNVDVLVRVIVGYEGWLKLRNEPLAGVLQIRFKPIIINTERKKS